MREFDFVACCSFGKGDSGETWVTVELTDEEAERLVEYGTQSDIYYGDFCDCEELKDIYNKVYKIAVEQITDELREFGDDWLDEEDAENPDWQADDTYACWVNFPTEFEDMLIEEEEN